jgi:hypothetical protein
MIAGHRLNQRFGAGEKAMSVVSDVKPLTFVFEDDGLVPNNRMPFLVYRRAIDVDSDHP